MKMNVPISKLKPIRRYIRRSYSRRFGSTAPANLPPTLGRQFMAMPDQGTSDLCTAFGEAVSSGYKYGIEMSPAYQAAFESKWMGFPILQGADAMQSMCASMVYCSLPANLCPYTLQADGQNFICNSGNFDSSLPTKALPYFPGVPYAVDGSFDVFDNIRSALFQEWQLDKSVVKAFGYWYESWDVQASTPGLGGHLTTPTDHYITLHRYNFIDWITDASGVPYLVAALTQGPTWGDRGHLYMNRDCVNTVFSNLSNGLGLYIGKPSSLDLTTTMAYFNIIMHRAASIL